MTRNTQSRFEKLKSLMTCPICNELMKDVTTICECLHSFCRNCIHTKITQERLRCCPVCNTDLGCAPLEKLRVDHNLQDIRTKVIFVRKEAKKRQDRKGIYEHTTGEDQEPEPILQIPMSGRRKERSISSLVHGPKLLDQAAMATGRMISRGKFRGSTYSTTGGPTEHVKYHLKSSVSLTTPSNNTSEKQDSSVTGELSRQNLLNKAEEIKDEELDGMDDLLKPLNSLVQAATLAKCKKSKSHRSAFRPISPGIHMNETKNGLCHMNETKNRLCNQGNDFTGKSNGRHTEDVPISVASSSKCTTKRIHRHRPKKSVNDGLNISAQTVAGAANNECRVNPIWFTLVASENQKGCVPLPQVPSPYLMIKDANLSVAFIQKYIVKKLDLENEAEVDICLGDQPLPPTLQLHNLLDLWCKSAPSLEKIKTYVGRPAKEFVMALSYCRRAQPS